MAHEEQQGTVCGASDHYQSVMSSNPIKGSCCFLEPETLPSLLGTGWVQKQI